MSLDEKQNSTIALERTGWSTRKLVASDWAGRCVDYAILSANVYGTRGYSRISGPPGWEEIVSVYRGLSPNLFSPLFFYFLPLPLLP